jgi:putative ABC transport system permease protein
VQPVDPFEHADVRRTRQYGQLRARHTGKIGYVGITVVNVIAPRLTATVDDTGGSRSLAVHLNAHTNTVSLAGAALMALAAALVAGTLAAWRTTRLPPAQALTALD